MSRPLQHYLSTEGKRNRAHAGLFQRLLSIAWGECSVIVGHHVSFQFGGDLETEDEIPSADTLLFDHEIMGRVFGDKAAAIMARIAPMKPGEREMEVGRHLDALEGALA